MIKTNKAFRFLTISILALYFLSANTSSIMANQKEIGLVDITKYLPNNYVTDGSKDYTSELQKGLNENKRIRMPNFPILINENGLKIKSDSEIYFQEKSKLIMVPNHKDTYAILWLIKVANVKIYSPNLIGDRLLHKGTKGEWGMGIHITESKDVYIQNASISNCWGDGIYIGGGSNPCERIIVKDTNIDNSRRNGISITNGKEITLSSCFITNTNGTRPMAAIDIEPNKSSDIIDNIHIKNTQTKNNKRYGILIELNPLIKAPNKVNITIDGHRDMASTTALAIAGFRGNLKNKHQLKGKILILNSVWENNIEQPYKIGEFRLGPTTHIENYKIIKNNKLEKHIPNERSNVIIRNRY